MGQDGHTSCQGTFDELMSSNSEFASLMEIYQFVFRVFTLILLSLTYSTAGGGGLKADEHSDEKPKEMVLYFC